MTTFQILGILFLSSAITSVVIALVIQFSKKDFGKDSAIYLAVVFGLIGIFCVMLGS